LGRPIPVDNATTVSTTWVQEHRNTFCVTLDLSASQGKEMFLELVSKADIWMESSKAGTYDKWGLDDDTVLAANAVLAYVDLRGRPAVGFGAEDAIWEQLSWAFTHPQVYVFALPLLGIAFFMYALITSPPSFACGRLWLDTSMPNEPDGDRSSTLPSTKRSTRYCREP